MFDRLYHVAILGSNREETLRFYQTLGFKILSSRPWKGVEDDIFMLGANGVEIELFIDPNAPARLTDPQAYGLTHLALHVTDIEANIRVLQEAGYEPEPMRCDSITGEKMVFVKDPDGLPIELHE